MHIEFDYEIYSESITGYHGTDNKSGVSILSQGFKPSDAKKSRLGYGVYFYEHAFGHAFDWADKRKRIPKEEIFIIQASIVLGCCLNITDTEHLDAVKRVAEMLKAKLLKGKTLSEAIVINYICKFNDIDTVKTVFTSPQSKPLFKGSKLVDYQQIVLCVRNLKQITSMEKVAYD